MLQGMNELLGPIYYVFANAARTNACDYCCCVQETTDACTFYFHRAQLCGIVNTRIRKFISRYSYILVHYIQYNILYSLIWRMKFRLYL